MNTIFSHKVQYYETDKMGVVHHSNYIRFFEEARTHYFEETGLSYQQIENKGVIVPVLSVECDFKQPTTYGDTLDIQLSIGNFNGIKFEFNYTITSHNGDNIHVTGKTRHCFLDSTFKPILVKKTHPDIYAHILTLIKQID